MFSKLPKSVRLFEVGPRDGLQNEQKPVVTKDKFAFIEKLALAGHTHIELTSFVRPSAIPQLSDAAELVAMVKAHPFKKNLTFSCLVPNMKGLEKAIELNCEEVAVFVATSDSFSQRNINATVDESFERLEPVAKAAEEAGIKIRGYVSTVFGCPYEGEVKIRKVVEVSQRLWDMGCYEISLGDTTGIGTPLATQRVLEAVLATFRPEKIAMHFHDTRGMALANILVSLEMGITAFDASAGGIGGCPYAKGASGNVATEDVVYMMDSLGIKTGVNLEKLAEASAFMLKKLGKESPSKLHRVIAR